MDFLNLCNAKQVGFCTKRENLEPKGFRLKQQPLPNPRFQVLNIKGRLLGSE